MAGDDQHCLHEPDHRVIRRLASRLRHPDPCRTKVRQGLPYVFRASNGFIIALTYSSESEWVKNVLAAGGCELRTVGKTYHLSAPKVVRDQSRQRFPIPVRIVLNVVGADKYMELSTSRIT